MNGAILNVGDNVVINIHRENWEKGFRPCQENGVEATVTGFGLKAVGRTYEFGQKPGYYFDNQLVRLITARGEQIEINALHLELANQAEYKHRLAGLKDRPKEETETFLRDLPDLPFYEWDRVRITSWATFNIGQEGYINRILYTEIGDQSGGGIYNVILDRGGYLDHSRRLNLELIERGNIWHYYHNEPITFKDLEEEIRLAKALGRYSWEKNPSTKQDFWSKEELIAGIKGGLIHGIYDHVHMDALTNCAIKYTDEELGRRVAEYTLQLLGRS